MSSFKGSEYTVYNKISKLMDGYKHKASTNEVRSLRSLLKKAYLEVDKKLEKLENE